MKNIGLTLFCAALTLTAFAQEKPKQSRFRYQTTMTLLSTVVDSRVEDLFYNGTESVYVTYAPKPSQLPDTTVMKGDTRLTIEQVDFGDGKDFTVYQNFRTGKMDLRTVFSNGKICIVHDDVPKLDWQLEPEKKRIGPYECQKATTTFRCAKYTVWFTTAIPLSIGPAKLSGLPGLIVEALNERNDVSYKLLTADYPSTAKPYIIAPPKTGDQEYSFEAFRQIETVEADKVAKFIAASAEDPQNPPMITPTAECLTNK
ncbi:GLPGLI family protein [Spirosoma soli]|uniref:GLPGLI family protein n=1 Tax=Spirosoma soli TaxID=1770529 RepID=A0ABW5MAF6_9BACT